MNWLNLEVRTLRCPEYIGSEPADRATWLNLLAYCCEQENGGRIVGAGAWKDRQWQQTCGVTLAEIDAASALLIWQGPDLFVWNYPAEKEAEVRAKRELAQKNGKRGGRPPKQVTEEITDTEPTSVSENNQRPKAEGKGKEGEGEIIAGTAPPPADDKPKKPKAEPTGDHARFIKLWTDAYPAHHDGNAYLFQGGKDGNAAKHLVTKSGKTPEQIMALAVEAWEYPLGFYCKFAASLSTFSAQFNNIQAELSSRALELDYREPTPKAFSAPMNKPPERPAHLK